MPWMPCSDKGLPGRKKFLRGRDDAQNGKDAPILAQAVTRTSKIPYSKCSGMPGIFNRNPVVYLDNGGGWPVSA
jgi:hypothetical protein